MASRWTEAYLDSLREVGDPTADAVIAALVADGSIDEVNRVLRELVRADQIPDALPEPLRRFLEDTRHLPPWADREAIERAQRIFGRFGRQILLILGFAALPEGYCHAKLANTLFVGSRIASDPKRRVIETSQLLIDVMEPGGLEPDGRGIRTLQKVRLMHAAMRTLIPTAAEYDAAWGLPVNQEDMAATLATFSWLTIDLLPKLGVTVSAADQAAYLHTWRAIGYVLGVREDALVQDVDDGANLAAATRARHYEPSAAGRALTAALIGAYEDLLPGRTFDGVPASMIRDLIGDTYADMVDVPRAGWTRFLKPIGVVFGRLRSLLRPGTPLEGAGARVGLAVTRGLLSLERGGSRPAFAIPTSLQQEWGIAGER